MTNPWIEHVKQYAKEHNITYKQSLKEARADYKPVEGGFILKKRKAGIFPPKSRQLIGQVGGEKVVSLRVERRPILTWLNYATFGLYKKALRRVNYDRMFHLYLVINNKYMVEKNEVLNFVNYKPLKQKRETMEVVLPKDYNSTINELLDNTRTYMGDEKFSNYDVDNNNCQVFVASILQANKLITPRLLKFVKQNVASVLKQFPFSKTVITGITDLAARINRLVEGEGRKHKKHNIG